MTGAFQTRWGGRVEFAEVAEAVGVRTDQILAMGEGGGGGVSVMFSREDGGADELPIFGALMRRGADGVLSFVPGGEPAVVCTWGELVARIEGSS